MSALKFIWKWAQKIILFVRRKFSYFHEIFFDGIQWILAATLAILLLIIGLFVWFFCSIYQNSVKTGNEKQTTCESQCESHEGLHEFEYPSCYCNDGVVYKWEEILLPVTEIIRIQNEQEPKNH